MTDITLNHVDNLKNQTTAVNVVNDNSDNITEAFEDTLSRSQSEGNQMETNLDMNSFQILNLPYPLNLNSPLRLKDLEDFNNTGTITTIPAGGTTGQVLSKASNVDYDVDWEDKPAVGLSMPSDFTVSNSPVTGVGTLTVTRNTEGANKVLIGPTSGVDAVPSYRTLTGADLPNPTSSAKGGVKAIAADSNKWINSISTDGTPTLTQPAASDLTNGTTGSGNVVLATSPTMTSPTIGAATATSINGMLITAASPSSRLTVQPSRTFAVNNTMTLTATDGVTIPFGSRTRQTFTSGSSATYTTPTNVKYIEIRMVGGGGGGAGGGTTGGTGGNGTSSTFSTFTAPGGNGGAGNSTTSGGTGGIPSTGSVRVSGGSGGSAVSGSNANGGQGAVSFFGGGGNLGTAAGAAGGAQGYGSGGGGGGNISGTCGGGGGGAGGYLEAIITAPSATYTYTVGTAGTAGTAGTNGNAGAAGAAGIIIVDEFYV